MNKRLYIVAVIVTLVFSLLTVTSNAASGFKVSLNPSSTSVAKGSEVTVNVNISDFEDNVEKGISSVTGKVTVDDKAFESLTEDSFEKSSDWQVSFDESTGELTCKKLKAVTKSQDICEITLKAKSSTSNSDGNIKITNLKATDGDAELTADDVSLDITIGTSRIGSIRNTANTSNTTNTTNTTNTSNTSDENTENVNRITFNTSNNTNTNNTNTNTNNTNTSNSSRYNTNTNNNSSDEKMPNTGLDDSIVKAIILVAIVGLFGYIKVKSLDRE